MHNRIDAIVPLRDRSELEGTVPSRASRSPGDRDGSRLELRQTRYSGEEVAKALEQKERLNMRRVRRRVEAGKEEVYFGYGDIKDERGWRTWSVLGGKNSKV